MMFNYVSVLIVYNISKSLIYKLLNFVLKTTSYRSAMTNA